MKLSVKTIAVIMAFLNLQLILCNVTSIAYRYPRRRFEKGHLKVSEYFKSSHIDDRLRTHISGQSNVTYKYYENSSPRSKIITYDELVFEAIDKVDDHRISPFYIFTYDNDDDKRRSSDVSIVSQNKCRKHVSYLIKSLTHIEDKNHNENNYHQTTPELAAFFDSYAKQEAGVLLGNIYWTGDYNECTDRHIFHLLDDKRNEGDGDGVIDFKGRYCVASIRSPQWKYMVKDRLTNKKNFFKSDTQRKNYAKLFRVQLGICLPNTCDSNSLEHLRNEFKLLTTSKLESPFKDYDLFDLYCLPDGTSPLRQLDTSASLFIYVISFWLSIIAIATYIDIARRKTNHFGSDKSKIRSTKASALSETFINIFSFRINYNKFMHIEQQVDTSINTGHQNQQSNLMVIKEADESTNENADDNQFINNSDVSGMTTKNPNNELDLRFLSGFKAMAMLWIINTHIVVLAGQVTKNILHITLNLDIVMHFLMNGNFVVDIFFTMTGFLSAYLLFNKGQAYKMKPFIWLYFLFHRYWRLVPMYIMAFWFSKSIAQHLGSGPLWDYGTSNMTFRGLCNHESWWYPTTLTSNLHDPYEECMITSWYIACDMQFWLASPIIIYLLAKSPRLGWSFASALIALSCALRFDELSTSKAANYIDMLRPRGDIFRRIGYDMPRIYTHPQYRISSYIIGILAGHFVYMVKSGKWQSKMYNPLLPRNNSIARTSVAIVGAFLLVFVSIASYLFSNYCPDSWEIYSKELVTAMYAVLHSCVALGVALVFVTMSLGQWQGLKNILSQPFLIRLSRINYALLLLHCEAIYFRLFRNNFMMKSNDVGSREVHSIFFDLLLTLYPIGLLVTVLIEYPLANLEKELIANKIIAASQRASRKRSDNTITTNCQDTKTKQFLNHHNVIKNLFKSS